MYSLLAAAIQCHRSGQLEAAVHLYRQVLAQAPDHAEAVQHLGQALQGLGRLQEAAQLFHRAIELQPDSATTHNSLANLLRQLGQADEALTHFQRAAELAPGDPVIQGNLGQMLLSLGRWEEAIAPCRQAVRLQPDNPLLHLILGDALRCAEQFDAAERSYRQVLCLQPTLAQAHANLGLLHRAQNRTYEAFGLLRQALALDPRNPSYWKYLAEAHADWEDFGEAIRCWECALALQPQEAALHLGLGAALQGAGRIADAEKHLRTAVRWQPDWAEARLALGKLHEQLGDRAQAEAAFRTALRLNPSSAQAHWELAQLLGKNLPEADCQAMEQRLANPHLPPADRVKLLFALAAVRDAQGNYQCAADYARQANALHLEQIRRRGGYSPQQHQKYVAGILHAFGADFFARTAGGGLATRRPVFIVGLPRSGTTLVEQILASHPRVYGAGELQLAWQSFMAIPAVLGRTDDVLACVPHLNAASIRRLAEQHLQRLEARNPHAARIVDKMPANYEYLGLLAAMFPQAVFLHCRRDLRDVAVSCWLTHFRWLKWTNDFEHIATRFTEYLRLMEHWRKVLPVPLYEVDYEEIVADLEGTARRLVAICGLDWNPACLEFYRNQRAVRTASAAQVRQPIYTRSIGRWRHYEKELADLLAQLPIDPERDSLPRGIIPRS